MKQAERIWSPNRYFINTTGAYPGVGAEKAWPKFEAVLRKLDGDDLREHVLPLCGEGWFWRALALGVANRVWMLENSIAAVLSPEGFASILWKDGSRAMGAAEVNENNIPNFYKWRLLIR